MVIIQFGSKLTLPDWWDSIRWDEIWSDLMWCDAMRSNGMPSWYCRTTDYWLTWASNHSICIVNQPTVILVGMATRRNLVLGSLCLVVSCPMFELTQATHRPATGWLLKIKIKQPAFDWWQKNIIENGHRLQHQHKRWMNFEWEEDEISSPLTRQKPEKK